MNIKGFPALGMAVLRQAQEPSSDALVCGKISHKISIEKFINSVR